MVHSPSKEKHADRFNRQFRLGHVIFYAMISTYHISTRCLSTKGAKSMSLISCMQYDHTTRVRINYFRPFHIAAGQLGRQHLQRRRRAQTSQSVAYFLLRNVLVSMLCCPSFSTLWHWVSAYTAKDLNKRWFCKCMVMASWFRALNCRPELKDIGLNWTVVVQGLTRLVQGLARLNRCWDICEHSHDSYCTIFCRLSASCSSSLPTPSWILRCKQYYGIPLQSVCYSLHLSRWMWCPILFLLQDNNRLYCPASPDPHICSQSLKELSTHLIALEPCTELICNPPLPVLCLDSRP